MAYRTLLVSLNDVERADALLEVAGNIAARQEAHVEGIFVIPALRVYPVVTLHVPPEYFESQRRLFQQQADEMRGRFEDFLERRGLSGEWVQVNSPSPLIADAVIEHGRRADLLIASQPPKEDISEIEADFAERLVLESGRPVLFVPRAGRFATVGEVVVAGWNATREATRAIHDALPLLARASDVRLAWVDPEETAEGEEPGDLPGAELAAALARHGVPATVDTLVSGGLDAGEVLLNHVADTGADMLVMGGWGHSRLREYVFGGATQHVMDHMTVPVLFSH
jgi:nucleotide-binding universal stress UspA family protein